MRSSVSAGGVLIAGVVRGGPAADAGLQAGMLVGVAGQSTETTDDIAVALAQEKPGAKVPVQLRGTQGSHTVQVTLGQAPASAS
jgi:S1-C subfamily serine protease